MTESHMTGIDRKSGDQMARTVIARNGTNIIPMLATAKRCIRLTWHLCNGVLSLERIGKPYNGTLSI
jgi:hypothetical protein